MNIQIINYSQGPLEFNRDIWYNIENKQENINIDAICQLRYSASTPVLGIQFDFTVTNGENLVLKTGFLFGLGIESFVKLLSEKKDLDNNREIVAEILQFVWPAVVGAIASQTSSPEHKSFIVPPINIDEYAKQVILSRKD